jgi:hypothetical protein
MNYSYIGFTHLTSFMFYRVLNVYKDNTAMKRDCGCRCTRHDTGQRSSNTVEGDSYGAYSRRAVERLGIVSRMQSMFVGL